MALVLHSDDVCGKNMGTVEGGRTMLSRINAGEILNKYGEEARWVNHCVAVAAP